MWRAWCCSPSQQMLRSRWFLGVVGPQRIRAHVTFSQAKNMDSNGRPSSLPSSGVHRHSVVEATWRGGKTPEGWQSVISGRRHFWLASCLLFFKHVLCWNFHVLLFLRPTEWHPLQVQGLVMVDRGSQKLLDLLLLDHLAQLLDQSHGLSNSASRPCWEDCIDPDTSWLWIHFDLRHLPHHAHMLCGWWHLSLCFQGRECGGYMSKCLQMHGHLQQCGGVSGHLAGDSCLRQHGQHLLYWSQDRSDLQLDLCGHFHVGQVLPGSC